MKINKVDHITINTKDIEKTRRFYSGLLGFKEKKRVDCGDHRYYIFNIDDQTDLEVGSYDFDGSVSLESSTASGKIRHIAFSVDNIEELKKTLEESGYEFITDVAYRGKEFGFISGQVLDPNGVELEFLQRVD